MAVVGVVTFPGSNCERETLRAFGNIPGVEAAPLWHKETDLDGLDLVVLPGGFSYGDHLRAGAIARFSPLMSRIVDFAHAGGFVLGICNGFQILTEAGLLPGALVRNRTLRYVSRTVPVRVEREDTPWTCAADRGQVLHLPVAHGEGNYVHHVEDLKRLEAAGQVLLRYSDPAGELVDAWNPNGSAGHVAGIRNSASNVFGLMPHPERAAEARTGNRDGAVLLRSIVEWTERHGEVD